MGYKNWIVDREGQIVSLSLQRLENDNNLSAETLYELREIASRLNDDEDVRVVILQGKGRHFSTGVDLQMIAERLAFSEADNRKFLGDLQRCLDEFESLRKPTIAKIQGFCIGGGVLLALCCDFRLASKRTVFSLPEIKLGLPVLWGMPRITRVIGMAATKELVYLGGRFKADKALHHGMIHRVVPPQDLDPAVTALAKQLIRVPAKALELSKRIIHEGDELTLRQSQDIEIDVLTDLLASPETRQAFERYSQNLGVLG